MPATKTPAVTPILLTRKEAARALSCSERHLSNLEAEGLIYPVRYGARFVRYTEDELRQVPERMKARRGK